MNPGKDTISYREVTDETWPNMQELFGDKGAYGGCWCMYWRLKSSDFNSMSSNDRKEAMGSLISSGTTPGVLAFRNGKAVGWCSIGRRTEFVHLENSRILKRVDDEEVWSIVCFYIDKKHRRTGVMKGLIGEVKRLAGEKGAKVLESYPIDPLSGDYPDPYAYTGLIGAFLEEGFVEINRRSEKRPIMRYYIDDKVSGLK